MRRGIRTFLWGSTLLFGSLPACRSTGAALCAHETAIDARLDRFVSDAKALGGPVLGSTAGLALDLGNTVVQTALGLVCIVGQGATSALSLPVEAVGLSRPDAPGASSPPAGAPPPNR